MDVKSSNSKADELFFVVDENDQPLAPLPRKAVHGHGVWHRVAHIWILDGNGNVLCQQRSLEKELNPGGWEPFFGGHLRPDESYTDGARRELLEEIHLAPDTLVHDMTYKRHDIARDGYNNEFQGIFTAQWNGDLATLSFDDGEVARIEWQPLTQVLATLNAGNPLWTNCGYGQRFITELIKSC